MSGNSLLSMRVVLSAVALCFIVANTLSATAQSSNPASHPYPAGRGGSEPVWFVNVAPQAGLNMVNVNGEPDTKKYIIETTGSGVAIIEHVIIGHDYFFNGIYCSSQIFVGSNERVAPCVHMINETFAQAGIYRSMSRVFIAVESCACQLSGCHD